ncbi:MAG TPA: GldG family protein, partial [Xanthomonadales bacterium]|nr:GldG family protein [Xanthomonadales bacterium]
MGKNRSVLAGGTLVVLAVLFVAAIVISNVLFRGWRVDLTENSLYTLSEGTKRVLAEIPEPINLYFYFSEDTASDRAELQPVRDYATRVREMLEEMAALSGGKIHLQVVDPLPFSEEEDKAAAYGLQAIPVSASGENIYFGLAGTNSTDGQMIIPFFQPDKETFLEYDVAKLVHGLSTSSKPKVGFISDLDMAPGFDPATRQARQGWAVYTSLSELFDVKPIATAGPIAIDKDIGTLVVVHPKALSDDALYAIDQFVLRGGKLALFVDPNAELDASGNDPENPQAAMFADRSSDVPKLFKAWGVEYDRTKVLLDAAHALPVQAQAGAAPVRHLAILGMDAKSMSPDDVVTAQLESVNFSTAGVIRLKEGSPLELSALVQSSG